MLLVQGGLVAAYGACALGFWHRGRRDAAIASALLVVASLARLWGRHEDSPMVEWLSLTLVVCAVAFFWRESRRARAAGPAA
jgi:hypothetical protein